MSKSAWWIKLLSSLPLGVLYGITGTLGWLAAGPLPHRQQVIRDNLSKAFPELDEPALRALMKSFYANFAQVLAEVAKIPALSPEDIRKRVRSSSIDGPRTMLASGQSILLVAAHQCNWEWMLLALSVELGHPVDAAYKPLRESWAEREMHLIRSRFGARMIPATDLLADIIKRRGVVRAICLLADQEPPKSERKHWIRFLNRDTAFFLGVEELARVTRFPVFFISMRRVGRGFYEMDFKLLAQGRAPSQPGELTEEYARLVEAQIRAAPADWPWSHRRWRLKKSLYGCSRDNA